MPRRPKKKKKDEDEEDDSDSDFIEESHETESVIKEEDEEELSEGEGEEAEAEEGNKDIKAEPVAISKRSKKRRRKVFNVAIEDHLLPTHERKTSKGGYAHTNRSKSLISKANTGNTPWNKGRNRSSADKAKIAAGVRARNRAILLEKLKRLGMSEEEYNQKKKEIKYLRERIRRSKAANAKHKAAEAELKLKAALDATTEKAVPAAGSKKGADGKTPAENEESKEKEAEEESKNEEGKKVFSRDIVWTPFSFGDDGKSYDQECPDGGPGGLICCESCCKKYSLYLSRTVKDIEVQRTHKVGKDAKEILEFLDQGRKTLDRAMGVARKKVPPLPPPQPNPEPAKQQTRRTMTSKQDHDTEEWNLTSTIDIGFTGGMTAV